MQFLCNGLEDDFGLKRHAAGDAGSELDRLIQSSGKMLLLHKLLPKLKAEGHKVHFSPHSYQSAYVFLTLLHSGQLTKSKLSIMAVRKTEVAAPTGADCM